MAWLRPWERGSGISRSDESRICGALDAQIAAFRARPVGHVEFPYLFLDATYLKGRVCGQSCLPGVVATVCPCRVIGRCWGWPWGYEDEAYWAEFLRLSTASEN